MSDKKVCLNRFLPGWVGAVSVVLAGSIASAAEFGYGEGGPEDWCNLDPAYSACCGGAEQSPINIITADADYDKKLPRLKFHYSGVTSLDVEHNGHSVQANVPSGAAHLELDGVVFNLLQFHFHTPSEHGVDGEHAPMEMHLVHKTSDGNFTAVVGVFIEEGKTHRELQKIWNDLPDEEGDEIEVTGFHLQKLLPGGKATTYRYMGSLTTPPCSEGLYWNLMAKPITMSTEQIAEFMSVFWDPEEFPYGNARPVQDLAGRVVVTDEK